MPSLGREADAVASWLQGQGLKKGDRVAIMLPNVMAYPAILFGVLHRRRHGGQRQSALYAARAHLSAQGFRRTLPVRAGELRGNRAGVAARRQARSRRARDARRSARPQGRHHQSGFAACEEGREAVPAAAARSPSRLSWRRVRDASRNRWRSRPTTSRSCNIRAARPASPRARCCSIATWPPT